MISKPKITAIVLLRPASDGEWEVEVANVVGNELMYVQGARKKKGLSHGHRLNGGFHRERSPASASPSPLSPFPPAQPSSVGPPAVAAEGSGLSDGGGWDGRLCCEGGFESTSFNEGAYSMYTWVYGEDNGDDPFVWSL
jgi:hypothetical protein